MRTCGPGSHLCHMGAVGAPPGESLPGAQKEAPGSHQKKCSVPSEKQHVSRRTVRLIPSFPSPREMCGPVYESEGRWEGGRSRCVGSLSGGLYLCEKPSPAYACSLVPLMASQLERNGAKTETHTHTVLSLGMGLKNKRHGIRDPWQ